MVDSALLPDISRPKADKTAAARPARPSEPGSFEKVQAELSESSRKPARTERSQPAEKAGRPAASDKNEGPAEEAKEKASDVSGTGSSEPAAKAPAQTSTKTQPDGRDQLEDATAECAIALFMPGGQSVTSGNSLPPAAPATPGVSGTAASAREFFLQMAQGGGKGKDGAAGKPLAALDTQAFSNTLTEAIDAKAGASVENPGTSLATGARGVEIREGSAIIRQYSTTVETPVQQGDWGDKMAGKISWLANQRISFAEIHLNPADLGPVDVRVSVQNDQASVAVHAANPSVRDLLELNGNRLRDMMQENGMTLARMDVSDQPSGQQRETAEEGEADGQGRQPVATGEGQGELDGATVTTGEIHMQWQSQVDIYA